MTSWSFGSTQMPSPVMRMAPNPRRLTVRSPPSVNVPLCEAIVFKSVCRLGSHAQLDAEAEPEAALNQRERRGTWARIIDAAQARTETPVNKSAAKPRTGWPKKSPPLKDAEEQQILKTPNACWHDSDRKRCGSRRPSLRHRYKPRRSQGCPGRRSGPPAGFNCRVKKVRIRRHAQRNIPRGQRLRPGKHSNE